MDEKTVHERGSYLRDAVFSASDGIITTFAIVSGSVGASFSNEVVIILGCANLLADGISMAFGTYLGVKSEADYEETHGDEHLAGGNPIKQGINSFASFVFAGFFPIASYVFDLPHKFYISLVIVLISMFVIGAVRGRFAKRNIIVSGFETVVIGGLAATVAYIVGLLIERYVL